MRNKGQILFFFMAAVLGINELCSSCSMPKQTWGDDYYSYSGGAYINGVECHPILSFGKTFQGLEVYNRNNLIKIEAYHTRGGLSSKGVGGKPTYRFQFFILTDTLSFGYGVQYSIGGDSGESIPYYGDLFIKDQYDGPQIVMAKVYDVDNGVSFKAREGTISVFKENRIEFDFVAESLGGERLIVSDGYIWGSLLSSNYEK